jgi:hypothetical protein
MEKQKLGAEKTHPIRTPLNGWGGLAGLGEIGPDRDGTTVEGLRRLVPVLGLRGGNRALFPGLGAESSQGLRLGIEPEFSGIAVERGDGGRRVGMEARPVEIGLGAGDGGDTASP